MPPRPKVLHRSWAPTSLPSPGKAPHPSLSADESKKTERWQSHFLSRWQSWESSRQTRLELQTGRNPPGHSASATGYKSFKLGFLFLPKDEFQAKWVISHGPKHENYVIMIYYLCTRAKECQRNGFPKKMIPLHIMYPII